MARATEKKNEVEPTERESAIVHPRSSPLSSELQRRVEVLQQLEACRGQPSYRIERPRAAQALGVSERSLRRLQLHYRQEGIEGLKRPTRCDEGESKVEESWREFIVKTYQRGNRGMRQMSRAQ
ncbi:MAG: helix-turn-helix domain-containing protein, partial [Leptolyngbyaceae bacterium]|nr:helix-turn-helix domain-containing protein [Leptolyngbyaceae bacterium]